MKAPQSPYDFQLTLRVMNSYSKAAGVKVDSLQIGALISRKPVVLTVRTKDNSNELEIISSPSQPPAEVEAIVRWVKKQNAQDFHIGLEFQSFVQL